MSGEDQAPKKKERQRRKKPDTFAQQALPFLAFLGALVFAALILVLQSPKAYEVGIPYLNVPARLFFRILVLVMAGTSMMSIFGSFAHAILAEGDPQNVNWTLEFFADVLTALSMLGFILMLSMVVYTVLPRIAWVIFFFGIALAILLRRFTHGEKTSSEISDTKQQTL